MPKRSEVFKIIMAAEPEEDRELEYYDDYKYLIKSNFCA